MNAFDSWASCWAPVKQVQRVYRYGTIWGCERMWEDWKRCLLHKHLPHDQRYPTWIDDRARQVIAQRDNGSSEDVWDSRSGSLVDQAYMSRIKQELLDPLEAV